MWYTLTLRKKNENNYNNYIGIKYTPLYLLLNFESTFKSTYISTFRSTTMNENKKNRNFFVNDCDLNEEKIS